jgi:regulation of enolase protein 1 (concanavalin A-like superfamily)
VPSGATTGLVVVTVGGVASNGLSFTVSASGSLPAPWTSQDVGAPAVAGQASYAAGTFSVTGGGRDIWDTADQFQFVYQALTGDGEIVARAASLQNTDSWAKAGVMIREDLTANAPNVVAQVTAAQGLTFQWRPTRGSSSNFTNGFPGAAPQWIRLVRAGNTFTGYYSATGTTWILMNSITVVMPTQVYVGLAVTSHNALVATTATFTNVTFTSGGQPNQPPVLTQPANQTSAEGNTVSLALVASDPEGAPLIYSATGLPATLAVNPATGVIAGTLTFTSAGTYTVTATASDGALATSKTFTWTVTDVVPPPSLSGLLPTSGIVGTSVTISGANFGVSQSGSSVRFNGTLATPTNWSDSSIVVPVPSGATTGPVVVTVNSVASNGLTFTVSAPGNLPVPWISQDVGSPAITGLATFGGGTFSLTGAGTDIWDSADQFQFAFQALTGDGEIIARVGSLLNTSDWAKAGVMIREDLTANARNVVAQVTALHGPTFQWRSTPGAASNFTSGFPGAAPLWVRLVRAGNTFSGYYSATGTTWSLMNTTTVAMAAQVYIGLAVTSHNAASATTATFDNVVVTPSSLGLTSSNTTETSQTVEQTAVPGDQVSLARPPASALQPNALAADDYDGDGKADVAAYRLSTGEWRVLTSSTNFATTMVVPWGTATDLPVPGDYDGDRKTDLAYYRPSTGTWSILTSSTGYTKDFDLSLGADGDLPVPGDFDGDGTTDPAVYSPSTGRWRILESTTNFEMELVIFWGTAIDIPAPGDYDGDGKTDPAVYRPSTGQWAILQSGSDYGTTVTIALGTRGDIPVPADYDGDGVTDAAVFEPATGRWLVRPSSHTSGIILAATLGSESDIPVAADYDGDGRADVAVFHSAAWQILYSSMESRAGVSVLWLRDTDTPLPKRP